MPMGKMYKVSKGYKKRSNRGNYIRKIARQEAKKVTKSDAEFKYYDVANTSQSINTTGNVVVLNNVIQGDLTTRRDGNKLKMYSLEFRGTIRSTGSDDTPELARMMIVQCTNQDDTNLTVATTEHGVLMTSTVYSPRNILGSAKNRYRIIWDKIIKVKPSITAEEDIQLFKYYKKWKNGLNVEFASEATDTPRKNSLYLVTVSTATFNGSFNYFSRIRFTDS